MKFFSKELIDGWKNITEDANFKNVSEEEIIKTKRELLQKFVNNLAI